jgi:hypothetical protein
VNINEILGCVVAVISIVSFLCVVIKWAIIDPLNKSIETLTVAVDDLKLIVGNLQNSETSLDKRLTVIETIMEANGCNHIKQ